MNASGSSTRAPGRPRRFDPATEVELIVKAAKKLLQENDYESVSVGAILDESGLSTRSFYRHYASKDGLLMAMYMRDAERVTERLRERVSSAGSPLDAVEAWVDEVLRLRYDSRLARRVAMFEAASVRRAVGYSEVDKETVHLMVEPLHEALERGASNGDFPLAEPARDALSIHALVRNVMRNATDFATRDEAREHVMRFTRAALGSDRPRRSGRVRR